MKNNAKSDYTIKNYSKLLKHISKHADLNKPEEVKRFIANKQTSNSHKKNLSLAYNKYCEYYKLVWEMPKYFPESKQIRIPTTEQVEMLIANSRNVMSAKLTLSKETGLRPIEVCRLRVKDIDLTQKIAYPTTAKHGSGRALRISNSLKEMLTAHIDDHNLNPNDKLFKGDAENYGKHYRLHRNKLAERLHKPELKQIRLYDLRHYFATMLYKKTNNLLFVKQQLGHRRIDTTIIYTQLVNFGNDEFTCEPANDDKKASELIENGFEYVATTPNGLMLFRKRK